MSDALALCWLIFLCGAFLSFGALFVQSTARLIEKLFR
jgi:hypothetical protein